jgi:membrane-bound lytic murein transglycosylase C
MRYTFHLTLIIFIFSLQQILFSQTKEDSLFQQFMKQQQQGIQEQEEAFFQYQQNITDEYKKFEEEQRKAFEEYVKNIGKNWGTKNVRTSSNKEWVSYNNDFQSRRCVDFEKGVAKVEILVDAVEATNKETIRQKLKEEISKMVVSKGNDDPLEKKEQTKPDNEPILLEQFSTLDGKPVTRENATAFAEQIAAKSETHQEEIKGGDGKKRVAIVVNVPLVPEHLKKRADKFRANVQRESKRFEVDASLAFAVIHTESFFNPKARSGVPAYGLMQLVPKSAGRDAYLFVHKVDSLLTPEYLYAPENNVELGTAYLNILLTKYFKNVNDERSRLYCAVAAYNTGAGNVARAFTGKTKLKPAVEKINSMTSDEVFKHLKNKLPFKETQDYVVRVTERMELYNAWR